MALQERSFIGKKYLGELLWGSKTPAIAGAVATGAYFAATDWIPNMPGMQEKIAAAQATHDAYQAELLRAYQFTYPNDTNVTKTELSEFEQVALGLDETFRYSNLEYQNHVYDKLVELYGSPQGELRALYEIQEVGPEALEGIISGVGLGAIIVAAVSAITLPFVANDRARYGRW